MHECRACPSNSTNWGGDSQFCFCFTGYAHTEGFNPLTDGNPCTTSTCADRYTGPSCSECVAGSTVRTERTVGYFSEGVGAGDIEHTCNECTCPCEEGGPFGEDCEHAPQTQSCTTEDQCSSDGCYQGLHACVQGEPNCYPAYQHLS